MQEDWVEVTFQKSWWVSDCDALVKIHQRELILKALSQGLMQSYLLAISVA